MSNGSILDISNLTVLKSVTNTREKNLRHKWLRKTHLKCDLARNKNATKFLRDILNRYLEQI